FFFFSSRRRHTRSDRDWSSDVCSSDLFVARAAIIRGRARRKHRQLHHRGIAKTTIVGAPLPLPPGASSVAPGDSTQKFDGLPDRSEERRVGKEWRARGGAGA